MLTASVTSTNTIKDGGYTVYEIKVTSSLSPLPWLVYKRYNEFDKMHTALTKWVARMGKASGLDRMLPTLPPKRWWKQGADAIKSRRLKLEAYLALLLIEQFLGSDALLDFLAVPDTLQQSIQESIKRQRSQSRADASRDSHDGRHHRRKRSTIVDESDRRLPAEEREVNTLLRCLLLPATADEGTVTVESFGGVTPAALAGLGKVKAMKRFGQWYLGVGGQFARGQSLTQPRFAPELMQKVLCGTKDIFVLVSGKRRLYSNGLFGACSNAANKLVWRTALRLLAQLLDMERHRDARIWRDVFLRILDEKRHLIARLHLDKHLKDATQKDCLQILKLIVDEIPDVNLMDVLHDNEGCKRQYIMSQHVEGVYNFGSEMALRSSRKLRRAAVRERERDSSIFGGAAVDGKKKKPQFGSPKSGIISTSSSRLVTSGSSRFSAPSRKPVFGSLPYLQSTRFTSGSIGDSSRGTVTAAMERKGFDCSEYGSFHEVAEAVHSSFERELIDDNALSYHRVVEALSRFGLDAAYKRHSKTEWKARVSVRVQHSARDVFDFLRVGYVQREDGTVEGWNRKVVDWKPICKLDEMHHIYEEVYKSFNSPYAFMSFTMLRCLRENDLEKCYRIVFASVSQFDSMIQSAASIIAMAAVCSTPSSMSMSLAPLKIPATASGITAALTPTSPALSESATPPRGGSVFPGSVGTSVRVATSESEAYTSRSIGAAAFGHFPDVSRTRSFSGGPSLVRKDSVGSSVSSTGSAANGQSGAYHFSSLLRQFDPTNTKRGTILPTGFQIEAIPTADGSSAEESECCQVTFLAHMTTDSVMVVATDLLGESDEFFLSIAGLEDLISVFKAQQSREATVDSVPMSRARLLSADSDADSSVFFD